MDIRTNERATRGIDREPCDGFSRLETSSPGNSDATSTRRSDGRADQSLRSRPSAHGVWIERRPFAFVADPGFATIYNPHQPYQRRPISPDGDLSDWLGVSERLTRDAVRQFDARDAEHPEPLKHAAAAVSSETYLIQRQLFARIAAGDAEPMEVEELALEIIVAVLRSAYLSTHRGHEVAPPRRGRARRNLVESAKAAMLSRLVENSSVSDLAQTLTSHSSSLSLGPAETGMNSHAYRRTSGFAWHSAYRVVPVPPSALASGGVNSLLTSLRLSARFACRRRSNAFMTESQLAWFIHLE